VGRLWFTPIGRFGDVRAPAS